jgi:hypothetical protein
MHLIPCAVRLVNTNGTGQQGQSKQNGGVFGEFHSNRAQSKRHRRLKSTRTAPFGHGSVEAERCRAVTFMVGNCQAKTQDFSGFREEDQNRHWSQHRNSVF